MSDITAEQTSATTPRRSGSLSAMRLAELQGLASSMGISGTSRMRKGDLVTAIRDRQSGVDVPRTPAQDAPAPDSRRVARREAGAPEPASASGGTPAEQPQQTRPGGSGADAPATQAPARQPEAAAGAESYGHREQQTAQDTPQRETAAPEQDDQVGDARGRHTRRGRGPAEQDGLGQPARGDGARQADGSQQREGNREQRSHRDERDGNREQRDSGRDGGRDTNRDQRETNRDQRDSGRDGGRDNNRENNRGPRDEQDDERGGRRNRRNRNRGRDKRRGRPGELDDAQDTHEAHVQEDDVLVPAAGILDVLDNYAFVRTSGYLPGSNDVYVPLTMVKRNGLRKGDAVTGAVKAPREDGSQDQVSVGSNKNRQKYNPLVRLDTVNGTPPEQASERADFSKLTPLYPQSRLRLETEAGLLSTRVIDLVAPIGKGQRGLIVAPAKAGKTMVMQAIANAITTNNPECHLMVVLVDERPEEVTEMQRAVQGEVISSTFDRPADDHTTVAELAIERAKRLVELGHDVVVLLDSITKLGRAYNLAAPASGRILSGGVDSAALYPPKKFFGAARNIENGGSLTILATALVETGSKMDEVIFEEFKGTGNMELKLDRQLANRRIFPAVDINASGTRREEILLAPEELKIMWKLRRVLAALDQQQGIELLVAQLRKNKTNYEFLRQVQSNSSIKLEDEDDD